MHIPDSMTDVVIQGECAYLMKKWLPDNCIDLTVTSPPYDTMRRYHGYKFNFPAIARQLWRITKEGGVVVWVVADETIDGSETGTSFRQALYFKEIGFKLADTMIYEVAGPGAKGSHRTYWQGFEYMFVFCKRYLGTTNLIRDKLNLNAGKTTRGERREQDGSFRPSSRRIIPRYSKRSNIWRYGLGDRPDRGHPAAFTPNIPRDHIISWSNPGNIVLDPMCGIGTTCIEAKKLGRRFLGFEISKEYVDLARKYLDETPVPLFNI